MWNALKSALIGILGSKKAVTAVTTAAVWAGGRIGLDLPAEVVAGIVAPGIAYILGQAHVDAAKEKAKAPSQEEFLKLLSQITAGTAATAAKAESLGGGK